VPEQGGTHQPDELAEGENPSTESRQKAERLSRMSLAAQRETERTNLPILQADSERFHARLAFWQGRLGQLKGRD